MNVRFSFLNVHGSRRGGSPFSAAEASHKLSRRRRTATLRTLILALCLALAATTLVAMLMPAKNQTIVVTSHPLKANHTIAPSDLRILNVADDPVLAGIATSKSAVVGRITTASLPASSPVNIVVTTALPSVPHDYTEISIPLASSSEHLHRGQNIEIAAQEPGTPQTGVPQRFKAIVISTQPHPSAYSEEQAGRIVIAVEHQRAPQLLEISQNAPLFALS